MGRIIVRGSVKSLLSSLGRLNWLIENRKAEGWRILQHDEDWFFFSQRDERVDQDCRDLEGTIHRGDYIPNRFPDYSFISPTRIYPQVHHGCRCELRWLDSAEKIRDRLDNEIRMVI